MEKQKDEVFKFLRNGQKVHLVGEIQDSFLVQDVMKFKDTIAGDIESLGNPYVVEELFDHPPETVYHERIQKLQKIVNSLQAEYDDLISNMQIAQADYDKLNEIRTRVEKLIIRKDHLLDAKSIHLFWKHRIDPVSYPSSEGSHSGLRIDMRFQLNDQTQKTWGIKIYSEKEGYTNSEYIDPAYGIAVDLDEKELTRITRERCRLYADNWTDYQLASGSDKYLTPELLKRKRKYLIEQKQKTIDRYREEKDRMLKRLRIEEESQRSLIKYLEV